MNADIIQMQFPHEPMSFLTSKFDDAIVGTATRARCPRVPVYSWLRAARLFHDGVVDNARVLEELFSTDTTPAPLVLLPIGDKEFFWREIRRGKLIRWEQLDDAIIGYGRRAWSPEVVAYSRPRAINRLKWLHQASENAALEAPAEAFFSSSIEPIWLGPQTPYFIEPRTQ